VPTKMCRKRSLSKAMASEVVPLNCVIFCDAFRSCRFTATHALNITCSCIYTHTHTRVHTHGLALSGAGK
jgi:hypothetical protein